MGIYDEALAKSLRGKNSEDFIENSDQMEAALSIGAIGVDTVKARKAATAAKLEKSSRAKLTTDAEFKALATEANVLRELKGLAPIRDGELLEKGLSAAKSQLRRENGMLKALLKSAIEKRRR